MLSIHNCFNDPFKHITEGVSIYIQNKKLLFRRLSTICEQTPPLRGAAINRLDRSGLTLWPLSIRW